MAAGPRKVLIVEDEPDVRAVLRQGLERKGWQVSTADTCTVAEQIWRASRPDIALLDYSLPDGNAFALIPRLRAVDSSVPLIVLTGYGTIDLAVEAIKLGADQFLTKPLELSALFAALQQVQQTHKNKGKLASLRPAPTRFEWDPFLGTSDVIKKLRDLAQRVVRSDSPLLIQGETGSGKGVLSRWLHHNGPRADSSFVDLNCAGLSRELLESELFGYERGAFTGAVQSKTGLLELADRGTVFLDEIGDVDVQIQPRLLKVLEEKQFRRLGDVRDRMVDIRLISATHQALRNLVQEKRFRDDLYFRICTIPLHTPPLRDRLQDIPVLSAEILASLPPNHNNEPYSLTTQAIRKLQGYCWPGNIRQLRNVLERAVLMCSGDEIVEVDLRFEEENEPAVKLPSRQSLTLEELERQHITQTLIQEGWRVESAARSLGIPRSSMYSKLKQYHISRPGADLGA